MQPVVERRHIEIEPCELQIAGFHDNAPDGGSALQIGVLTVGIAAGVEESVVRDKRVAYGQLIPLKQLCHRGLWLLCGRIAEYPRTVCAKLGFVCVNGGFRLMVNGAQGIDAALTSKVRRCGNGYIVFAPQFLHIVLQIVRRNAAHSNTASAGYRSCGKVEVKQLRRLFCVLAVNLKEIAHLKQHDVVRVSFLDGIVVNLCLCWQFTLCFLFPLKLRVPLLFPWGEEAVLLNEAVNPCCHLRPAQLHIGTACLFQRNAFCTMIFIAAACSGYSMGMTSCAILIFEESCLFLAGVVGGEVFVDPALAALDTAAAIQRVVDLVLRDEASQLRHCGHFGGIFSAWQGHIPQALPDVLQLVVMEAQQASVLFMGGVKLRELAG